MSLSETPLPEVFNKGDVLVFDFFRTEATPSERTEVTFVRLVEGTLAEVEEFDYYISTDFLFYSNE
jgi:hypothetical protein